jgi:hypothetical protein
MMAGMEQVAQAHGDGWRVPHDPPDADRRTDYMFKIAKQPLTVNNPDAARLKRTYVRFSGKTAGNWLTAILDRIAARVRQEEGWSYCERPFGHWPVLDKPREVAEMLLELG